MERFPYDKETDEYQVPNSIDGQRVVRIEDGFVLVDEIFEYDPDCEFDEVDEPALKAWLDEYGWGEEIRDVGWLTKFEIASNGLFEGAGATTTSDPYGSA